MATWPSAEKETALKIRVRALRLGEQFVTMATGREGACTSGIREDGSRSVSLAPLPQNRGCDGEQKVLHPEVMVEVSR